MIYITSFVGPWFWPEQLGWVTMWAISCLGTRRLLTEAGRVGTQ